MSDIRAKMIINHVEEVSTGEWLRCNAISPPSAFDDGGTDLNNTYASSRPIAELELFISNKDMLGKYKVGDMFYVDLIKI